MDFPGYAVGGLSVGEPKSALWEMVELSTGLLPQDRPRYLMGVGSPEDLVEGIYHGVDMFDCALPTRVARNGALFTRRGRRNILNASFAGGDGPFDPDCDCVACRGFPAAYLHHLFKSGELLGLRLATLHNLRFISRLVQEIRGHIVSGTFAGFRREFLGEYAPTDEDVRVTQKRRWLRARGQGPGEG